MTNNTIDVDTAKNLVKTYPVKIKTKERIKKTGEVFTPRELVLEMLDKLPEDQFTDPTKNFLDNSCGNGNFLVEIVKRKIAYNATPTQALKTTWGIELMLDNVEECRQRLLDIAGDTEEHRNIVTYNVVCHDALRWDYDNWCSPEETYKIKAKTFGVEY